MTHDHPPYEEPESPTTERDRAVSGVLSGRAALSEIVLLFLRLGFTAFGGPAAHIAMMRSEVVERRRWISSEQYERSEEHTSELQSLTNLVCRLLLEKK